ncbi:hypothetical protein [Sulfurihydrogenibium subterraneum]|nr:hypothetical protein [Sulfurihydrogenibium subterraneum]
MGITLEERLEQEMKKYEIKTFADIVKALIDHPDWLEEKNNFYKGRQMPS